MPIDWNQILQLAPLAMMRPGSPEGAAMMHGYMQSMQDLQRQRNVDRALSRQDATALAQIENLEADNRRAEQQFEMSKAQQALDRLLASRQEGMGALEMLQRSPETELPEGISPLQAQNALVVDQLAAQQAYGVPSGTPQVALPNMTQLVSEGKKRRAKKRYADFQAQYKEQAAEAENSMTDAAGEFAGMTFRAIREMAAAVPPPPLMKKTRPEPASGSFEEYVDAPPERQAEIRAARRGYMQADDKSPASATSETEPLVPVMGPDGKPVLMRRSRAEGMRPASTREQGRPVMSSDANRIAELKTSLDDVAVLKKTLSGPGTTGVKAKAGAMLPNAVTEYTGIGESAKQRQATIDRVKQVIGKALEGGVLRREDEYKYVKILPTIQDPPAVAASKMTGLEDAIRLRLQRTVESLTDAGFDTENFQRSGGTADPLGIR